jgi:hypothetical protein
MTKKSHMMNAVVAGILVAMSAAVAAPVVSAARAAAGDTAIDPVGDRIGAAFASVEDTRAPQALSTAAVRVAKGDLLARPGCAGATWPNIDADCLARVDGAAAPHARFITVGHEAGTATTVLIRIPAAEVVSR